MKKIIALSLALGLSSTAFASDLFQGDGTNHVVTKVSKSSLTRAEVVANTDSTNIQNSIDGSVSPNYEPSTMLSRADVIRKMEGYQFADFGDATNPTPWVKLRDDNSNLAQDSSNKPTSGTN